MTAAAPTQKKTPAKKSTIQRTHVVFIIDSSGSMYLKTQDVIGGYNQFIAQLRQEPITEYIVTAIHFDTNVTTLYKALPLADAPLLTEQMYCPSGNTALYDALGVSITELTSAPDEKVLVVIQTDGQENSSKRFTQQQVKQLIESKTATDRWTFMYLGADQDQWFAEQVSHGLGIHRGNTVTYQGESTAVTFASVSSTAQTYSAGTADMTNLGATIRTD